MNTSKLITMGVVLVALMGIVYSFMGTDDSTYVKKIEKQRDEKNQYMRTAEDSPFAKKVDEFQGLSYYPVDSKYSLKAKLIPIENKKSVELPTSDGKVKRYLEYAYAEFKLDENIHRLLILEIIDMGPYRGTLFLSFGDDTSARETYGAGRYLDVQKIRGQNSIMLDFNEAYNPYCAYNNEYSCPLPPRENLLSIAIKAGEKNYP